MTHTHSRQFEILDRGSQNELITEFIAIRASQRPKSTLQGIQADDVRNGNHVKQPSGKTDPFSSEEEDSLGSLAGLPNISGSAQTPPTSIRPCRSTRSSPSIENFSRPTPWSPVSPRSPPPRLSSRNALQPPSLSTKLISTSIQGTVQYPISHHSGDTQASLDSNLKAIESHVPTTHTVTAVGASGIPLETWPLPAASSDLVSPPSLNVSTEEEHCIASSLNRSTSLPLRHPNTSPTTEVVLQDDHPGVCNHTEKATESRSKSPQPESTGQWEDDVDYCYNNAVQADSNFDWSQKTVFMDDRDPIDTSAISCHQAEEQNSANDEQPRSSGSNELVPRCVGPRPPGVPARQEPCSHHTSQRSVVELEEPLSPFGRHQATSEFRGYQHMTQAPSKPTPKLHIASEDLCAEQDAFSGQEGCDYVDLETHPESYPASNRCYSGGWSSFRAARPSLSTHRSGGSVLSSTASTIRTYRSSNSIGSVPDLICSLNSSRESVTVEKTSPTDSIKEGLHQIPERVVPAPRRQVDVRRLTADLPPLPSFTQGRWSRDDMGKVPLTAPPITHGQKPPAPSLHETIDSDKKANIQRAKSQPVTRRRAASAVTPGHHLAPRASYSLFPSPNSTVRLM